MLGFPPLVAQGQSSHGSALFRLTPVGQPAWQLIVELGPRSQALEKINDLRFYRLFLAGLGVRPLRKEPWDLLLSSAELKAESTRWVLQDPAGKIQASGAGLPSSEELENVLRKSLGALPWDTLEAVLRVEPQHGEARLALAEWALGSEALEARQNSTSYSVPLMRYSSRWTLVSDGMAKLLAVPDWPSQLDLGGEEAAGRLGVQLRRGTSNSLLERMAMEVLEALRGDPANERLQRNLAYLIPLLSRDSAERMVGEVDGVKPLPGQEWPPLPLIHPQMGVFRKLEKWGEVRQFAAAWSRPADRLFLNPQRWQGHVLREATLRAYQFQAESWMDGWGMLPPAMDSLRQEAGSSYREMAKLMLSGANLPRDPDFIKELGELANRSPLPIPPMPAPFPPWNFKVRNPADLTRFKEAFDTSMGLLPWLPVERTFAVKGDLLLAVSVSLGPEAMDIGPEFPAPETLADRLRAARPGRLFAAWDHVSGDPDAPGPRIQRIGLLLERMPVRTAESVLADDLRRVSLGADLQNWELDENLWFTSAQKAIPAVEDRLRHWPLDAPRWAALAFWTAFLPNHRGPITLAEQLPSWKTGLDFSLCLPPDLHAKVGEQLQSRHAWPQMRAWFELAWEHLRNMKTTDTRRTALMQELGPVLVSFLDRAYTGLGKVGERRTLKDEWKHLQEP